MIERRPSPGIVCLAWALFAAGACRGRATEPSTVAAEVTPEPPARIRVATYNASLYRAAPGQLAADLEARDPQATDVAEIVRTVRPDILLLNELDATPDGAAATLLATRYFEADETTRQTEAISYPHRFTPPSNTGVPSGADLDHNGRLDEPADAMGYGAFAGQYGFTLFSRFPIRETVCFGDASWASFPWARMPDDPRTAAPRDWYGPELAARYPLSSKNHCDVIVATPQGPLHLLISHPTPPVFDGPEDRNGLRNNDEIRFWSHYIDTLPSDASFVIAGDLNADPIRGDAPTAIRELLAHPRVQDPAPTDTPRPGDRSTQTADFGDAGRLRVDYVLPSIDLTVEDSGIFWPRPTETGARWISASDHRLVWVDLDLTGPAPALADRVPLPRPPTKERLEAAAAVLEQGFLLACADKACFPNWPAPHGPTPTQAGSLAEHWPQFPLPGTLPANLEVAVTPGEDEHRSFLLHARDPNAFEGQPERVQVICRLYGGPFVSEHAAPQHLPVCDAPTFF